jgi:7,8-dihydropterin-6-yl-methyl-4-(beta-D-ribofuranosyl)aminobenzene 5'-phosphate synthase
MDLTRAKITILVDNRAAAGLVGEHGLSIWIEADGRHVLFDTGQGQALALNAAALDVDLRQTDTLVLSHGHFDHTGGVAHVLRTGGPIDTYCHPGVVLPRYSTRNLAPRQIQMSGSCMVAIDALPQQSLHWVQEPMRISERIGVTGPIPRETAFEDTGGPFYLDPVGRRADAMDNDLALWIETDRGLVVCVGCSHAGVVNTLQYILRLNPGSKIRAVVGGMHLLNASEDRLEQTIAALRALGPGLLVPCHCTGEGPVERMLAAFGDRALWGHSGLRLQF